MRVMRILTRPNVGGPTLQAAALFAAHRARGLRTLLAVGRCGSGERAFDLAELGVPRLAPAAVDRDSDGFVEVPGLGHGWSPAAAFRAGRALRALMQRFAPDVVHTHTSRAGWLGRTAARRAGVAVVAHTFHGHVLRDYFGGPVSWALRALERRLARRSDLLFAVSPSCADELAALGVALRQRLLVVPPAVPLPAFLPRAVARAQLGLAADAFAVACYGRLVPIKRVHLFVAAVAATAGCRGHVHGDGPLRAELERQAGPGGSVSFFGASPAARSQLAAYDALVLPGTREGCPLVAVEAFAAGVPVVGFDVPGVADVLGPWGGGFVVPAAAGALGLAAALDRVRTEPAAAAAAVERGRAGLDRFRPAAVAAALADAYDRALQARSRYAPDRAN